MGDIIIFLPLFHRANCTNLSLSSMRFVIALENNINTSSYKDSSSQY